MKHKLIDWFISHSRRFFFQEFSNKFQVELLKNFMDRYYIFYEKISYKFEFLSKDYLELYDELVEKEVIAANISSKDRVLVIGSGSLPATTVLIVKKTNAKVISIDKDPVAIKNASVYIKKNKLDKKIELKHAEGMDFPTDNFDAIFVLYGINKNSEILTYLSKNIKNDTLVIFRTAFDSLNHFKEGTNFLSNLFEIKNHIESEKFGKTNSFILKKRH